MSTEEVSGSSPDSGTRQPRYIVLPAEEFLRRFLQHVLPKRFRRVRTYGWLSPAAKVRRSGVDALLGRDNSPRSSKRPSRAPSPVRQHRVVLFLCPHCAEPTTRVAEFGRAPPVHPSSH